MRSVYARVVYGRIGALTPNAKLKNGSFAKFSRTCATKDSQDGKTSDNFKFSQSINYPKNLDLNENLDPDFYKIPGRRKILFSRALVITLPVLMLVGLYFAFTSEEGQLEENVEEKLKEILPGYKEAMERDANQQTTSSLEQLKSEKEKEPLAFTSEEEQLEENVEEKLKEILPGYKEAMERDANQQTTSSLEQLKSEKEKEPHIE